MGFGQRSRWPDDQGWPVSSQQSAQRRLLVVDDERVQRVLVARAVESMGFIVDGAADLQDAAEHLSRQHYDAVVLDLSLGETEGISLLRALRDARCDPLLIFLSGLDERVITASLRLASSMGLRVAGMLRKPAAPAALRALLRDRPAEPERRFISPVEPDPTSAPPTIKELAAAVRNGKIVPHFQPQVSLRDGSVVGVEALARWPRHKGRGPSPEVFVAMAEQSGLIVPLTFHIMRASLEACGRWRSRYPECRVAVNISPLVLADPRLPDEIDRILHETRLGPGALIAEITESTVIANPMLAAEVLTRLRIKGVELSIDDFGTGHSSLLALLRLPFSELKIDRSFVSQCEFDPEAWKIVRATVSMARELGLRVVAEGIETDTVLQLLRGVDCGVGQGWLFGHAMPEEELIPWLGTNSMMQA
jgi:EAL domain-containing protein (putative c-di-GMP-specific phosphodiesterase class I)/ActR/RegA family two-component response regulator